MKDTVITGLVAALVVAAFVVGMLWGKVSVYEQQGGEAKQQAVAGTQAAPEQKETVLNDEDWSRIASADMAVKGEENAQVTIVEFTDYECPFCARYYEAAYQEIMENYVNEGKVRYILRELPLGFHQNAKPAALAALCAGEQEKYWEMHDALFANQTEWAEEADPTEVFARYAGEIGLETAQFGNCYEEEKYAEKIEADLKLAQEVGASGTPTFYINGKQLVGAQPFAAFEAVIEEELNN